MKKYLSKVKELEITFERVLVTRVPREDNACADSLARLGSGIDE
jgi:hypothetical protein